MAKKVNGSFTGHDILSLDQFNPHSIDSLFAITDHMRVVAQKALPSDLLKGNIIVLLFYEPSSRTRGSFDAAVKQLGGQTVVVENPQQFSSVSKGETFEDTIRVFESYSDAIVLRHPEKGSALKAAKTAQFVPIINAGDGVGEHPTQALLDLYTIYNHTKTLSGLTCVFAGDIKNGRTINSLLKGLSLYKNNNIYLLSPDELKLSQTDLTHYKKSGLKINEIKSIDEIPKKANFWYWTRVQKERFKNSNDYHKVNNKFVVTPEILNKYAGKDTILMHPLPRVGEILETVDKDSRAVYLRTQVRNGMYIRMALLALVLGKIRP